MVSIQLPITKFRLYSEDQPRLFSASIAGDFALPTKTASINCRLLGSKKSTNGLGGLRGVKDWGKFGNGEIGRRFRCGYESHGVGSGRESAGDGDYVDSTVLDSVELKHGSDHLLIKLRGEKYLKCVYNQPRRFSVPDYISHPAIVLKMEDGSGLLLPIIVLELPSVLLMAALHNVEMARPTVYNIIKDMVERTGYMVKFVRITKRVNEAYFAELCITEVANETDGMLVFDLRPSDAINIAVRCKVPIQVSKDLAHSDGLKIVEFSNFPPRQIPSSGSLSLEMDRPDGQPCPESEEFVLVRNMLTAAFEERYREAARWKDLLNQFRSRRQKST